jgi:AcrR family transcriptional regulator
MEDRKTKRPYRGVEITRERILDAAERLFAQENLQSVSLRRIGIAAGAANHFVVQYHFGDKQRLIRALFERRLPSLEQRRAVLLDEMARDGRLNDPAALMDARLRPLTREIDGEGRYSYAGFLLGLHFYDLWDRSPDASDLSPLSTKLNRLLHEANGALPLRLSEDRLGSAFTSFLNALRKLDIRKAREEVGADEERAAIDDAIRVATAIFTLEPG